MQPLANRLHSLIGRLSQARGNVVAQAVVAEAVARIVQLERALGELLGHIDWVGYLDAGGSRLGDAAPVVSLAFRHRRPGPPDAARRPRSCG